MTVILHGLVYSSLSLAALAAETSIDEPSGRTDTTLGVLALVLAVFGFSLFLTSRVRKRNPQHQGETDQERNASTYFDRIRTGQDTSGPFGIHPEAYLDDPTTTND